MLAMNRGLNCTPSPFLRHWIAVDLEAAKTVVSQRGWLSHQPGAFRVELLRRTALRFYGRGEYIYHLEDAPGMMFGIVEGAVLIGVPHPIVGLYQAHLGRPGDWYGEAAALHGVTRRVAVEARVPVQILYLSIKAVQEMLQEQPLWQRNLSSLLLWNLENAIRTGIDLLIQDPKARVCARLLTLCGVRVGRDLPKGPIELPLTQDQLAMMCGLSRKSVHRALHNLESEKLCENRYAGIVVPSLEALEKRLMSLGSSK
jgi:CRP/FNR family transcriptional regulator, cyclic AMP receptor protein